MNKQNDLRDLRNQINNIEEYLDELYDELDAMMYPNFNITLFGDEYDIRQYITWN